MAQKVGGSENLQLSAAERLFSKAAELSVELVVAFSPSAGRGLVAGPQPSEFRVYLAAAQVDWLT
jgi:hypothetical protein